MHSNDKLIHTINATPPRLGRLGRLGLLGAVLAGVPACDSPAESDGRLDVRDLDLCKYDDFSVDITSGPSKGLHLAGTVYFIQKRPELHIGGMLQTVDGEIIPISASVNGQSDLSLTFHTAGGFVQGLGRMEGELCGADDITGAAIGPVLGGGYVCQRRFHRQLYGRFRRSDGRLGERLLFPEGQQHGDVPGD